MGKPKARKLSQIRAREGIAPFLVAIAKGADINERRGETSLVEEYFNQLMADEGNFWEDNTAHHTTLKKFKTLVTLGADTGTLFYRESAPYKSHYKRLLFEIGDGLAELSLILGSESLKDDVTGYRLSLLQHLRQMLWETDQAIADGPLGGGAEKAKTCEVLGIDYDAVLMKTIARLTLLSSLLQSEKGRGEITGWRREMLETLQASLWEAERMIGDTGLVDELGEAPNPYKTQESLRKELWEEMSLAREQDEEEPDDGEG